MKFKKSQAMASQKIKNNYNVWREDETELLLSVTLETK